MSLDSSARAALLAGALASSPMPDLLDPHIDVPAIRVVVPRQRPPLNLDSAIFHYRIDADGHVTAVNEPAGARLCSNHQHRH